MLKHPARARAALTHARIGCAGCLTRASAPVLSHRAQPESLKHVVLAKNAANEAVEKWTAALYDGVRSFSNRDGQSGGIPAFDTMGWASL